MPGETGRLTGKVCIVTGAGATASGDFVGIGQAISMLFSRQGARVIDPLGRYHYAKGLRDDVKPPESVGERTAAMHDMYWVTEEAMAEAAPGRMLAGGERTELPPTLCLARTYEAAHPRPDLDQFIMQYRKAGGQIDVTIFDGEGEGVLRDLSTDVAQQALEQMTAFIQQNLV